MRKEVLGSLAVLGCVGLLWSAARPQHAVGDCMEPAVRDGQLLFVNQLAPFYRTYQAGDFITFRHEGTIWFSRIVARGGDTVLLQENQLLINGAAETAALPRNWQTWNIGTYGVTEPYRVPEGHVFVLSDNLPADHDDSRVFGPIPYAAITGVVWS